MDQLQLKELKSNFSTFLRFYSELKRAKNQKERNRINEELEPLKSKMIQNFKLREHDPHLSHYSNDNNYFKCDIETIIAKLEEDNSNS